MFRSERAAKRRRNCDRQEIIYKALLLLVFIDFTSIPVFETGWGERIAHA